jgi:CRP-like cAMP-binding protein
MHLIVSNTLFQELRYNYIKSQTKIYLMQEFLDGEKIEFYAYQLHRDSYLRRVSLEEIKKILSMGECYDLEAGYELISQGNEDADFFIILEGEVIISTATPDGKESIEVARLKKNNTIGEIGCILAKTRTATVITSKPTKILRYSSEKFNTLRSSAKGFESALIYDLATRLEGLY